MALAELLKGESLVTASSTIAFDVQEVDGTYTVTVVKDGKISTVFDKQTLNDLPGLFFAIAEPAFAKGYRRLTVKDLIGYKVKGRGTIVDVTADYDPIYKKDKA
jgi:uncharacterized protein (DUF608 family)